MNRAVWYVTLLLWATTHFPQVVTAAEATAIRQAGETFDTVNLTATLPRGNYRFPAMAENSKGERLCIFRSGIFSQGYLYTYYNGSSWSTPVPIPGQSHDASHSRGSNEIVVDSEDRFQVIWEIPKERWYYQTFFNGSWETDPLEIDFPAIPKAPQGLAIRSNDELIIHTATMHNGHADELLGFKSKSETSFGHWTYITNSAASDIGNAIYVDENDHIWVAYKTDVSSAVVGIVVTHLDQSNNVVRTYTVSNPSSNSFLGWISGNNDGMLMVTWWAANKYYSRWYNVAQDQWSDIYDMDVSCARLGDFAMISKSVGHGNFFYCVMRGNGNHLVFAKFNTSSQTWDTPSEAVPDLIRSHDIFSAYDKILIPWEADVEPADIYLSTLAVEPAGGGKSPHVQVQHLQDHSLLKTYWFNRLTWKLPKYYIDNNLEVKHFHIYRKLVGDDEFPTTPLVEINVESTPSAETLYTFDDQDPEVDAVTLLHSYKGTVVFINDKGDEEESK